VTVRTAEYGPLSIAYDQRVLEPRPWTTAQSRWVSTLLESAPPGPVLEICCGAGHIGLLAVHEHARPLVMVDVDPVACSFAERNAADADMADRVTVRCGDMHEVLAPEERYAAIVADPPWVTTAEVGRFPDDPRLAIDGGETGFDLVRACVDVIGRHLAAGGFAVLQVGPGSQADRVHDHVLSLPWLGLRVAGRQDHDRGVLLHLQRAASQEISR
jgi:methylase of polypeptide subunit release factors